MGVVVVVLDDFFREREVACWEQKLFRNRAIGGFVPETIVIKSVV